MTHLAPGGRFEGGGITTDPRDQIKQGILSLIEASCEILKAESDFFGKDPGRLDEALRAVAPKVISAYEAIQREVVTRLDRKSSDEVTILLSPLTKVYESAKEILSVQDSVSPSEIVKLRADMIFGSEIFQRNYDSLMHNHRGRNSGEEHWLAAPRTE